MAMRLTLVALFCCFILGGSLLPAQGETDRPGAARREQSWISLEPGLDLGLFLSPRPAPVGDSVIRVLRIDPGRFEFRLLNASATKEKGPLTARQWCERYRCVAATNASMFQADSLTSVSLMRTGEHVNNPRLSKDRTILAFDRISPEVPPVAMIDRDCDDLNEWSTKYRTLVQSIRMLSCAGKNVWTQQPQRWSTAAIGMDKGGRVLFIHVRALFTTHDLVNILTELPLDLARAMYVEGGPEAQLYVEAGGRREEFVGSYEIAFHEQGANDRAWPVPNVVAVTRKERP
ncbi:MAG TPA: phosphodiester glycosidase family protein [Syntrophobacteria bacterium]|nr:phosphodiester glycosidase family protein [Syntrophobacteria bacterium]